MKDNVDYEAEYLNSRRSIDRMRDGQLAAMITVTGYPQAAIGAPELKSALVAAILVAPVIVLQIIARRRVKPAEPAVAD